MLKAVKKKKPPGVGHTAGVYKQITCGACNYQRQPADDNPQWQCPACGVAYNKVEPEPAAAPVSARQKLEQDLAYLRGRQQDHARQQAGKRWMRVSSGLGAGLAVIASALPKTVDQCVKISGPATSCAVKIVGSCARTVTPGNPWLLAVGGLIVAGTLAWAAYRYFF